MSQLKATVVRLSVALWMQRALSFQTISFRQSFSLISQGRRMVTSSSSVMVELGLDKKDRPRAIFFYDGGCGVCKYLVGFVSDRDKTDHMRFSPIQTKFAQAICEQYEMPTDLSTAVLIDEQGAYVESTSVLRIFLYMGFPYTLLGILGLLLPTFIRDFGYRLFARNRGAIWRAVKRVTGIGDTELDDYRDRILGLKEPIDPGWGFEKK